MFMLDDNQHAFVWHSATDHELSQLIYGGIFCGKMLVLC